MKWITIIILDIPVDHIKLSILVFNLNLGELFDGFTLILAQHSLERLDLVVIAPWLLLPKLFFWFYILVHFVWIQEVVGVYFSNFCYFSVPEDSKDAAFDGPAVIYEFDLHHIAQDGWIFLYPIRYHFYIHLQLPQLQSIGYLSSFNIWSQILRCRHLFESFPLQTLPDDFGINPRNFIE